MRGLVLWIAVALVGCYDQPTRNCPFTCGLAGECPENFECAADNLCHKVSGGGLLPCEVQLPDSSVADAPIVDGPAGDAPADAAVDAFDGAVVDADPDIDARPDAIITIPDAIVTIPDAIATEHLHRR